LFQFVFNRRKTQALVLLVAYNNTWYSKNEFEALHD
jgi:hypothetical protein